MTGNRQTSPLTRAADRKAEQDKPAEHRICDNDPHNRPSLNQWDAYSCRIAVSADRMLMRSLTYSFDI